MMRGDGGRSGSFLNGPRPLQAVGDSHGAVWVAVLSLQRLRCGSCFFWGTSWHGSMSDTAPSCNNSCSLLALKKIGTNRSPPNSIKRASFHALEKLKCRSFSENVAQDKSAVCVMLALRYFKICIHMTIALSR